MLRTNLRLTLLLLTIALPMAGKCWAQEEYQIKAAFLYNFSNYVDWPKDYNPRDDNVFYIGVLGPDPFGNHLKALSAQTVKGKKIVVQPFAAAKDYKPCHLLFIADKDLLDPVRKEIKGGPVLLVSDTPGLARKGAMINLYLDAENKVKFEINNEAATKARLTISGRLLQLGTPVKGE